MKKYPFEYRIIEDMAIVREYCSLFHALRQQLKIPSRQPLLDYGYGSRIYDKKGFVPEELRYIIAKDINIAMADDNNYGMETVPPEGDDWVTLEKNGLWVSLYTKIPPWLAEVGEKRKLEREKILENQRKEKNANS